MDAVSTGNEDKLVDRLKERIKELECFVDISSIAANPDAPQDQILQDIINRIPPAFRQPDAVCARLIMGPLTVQTANFRDCQWVIESPIAADGKEIGTLSAGYFGEVPRAGAPFLNEEEKLLKVIAARLGLIIHSNALQKNLKESDQKYLTLVETALVGITQSNLQGDLLYANSAGLRMFGYETLEEGRAGGTFGRYRNPEDRKNLIEMLKQTGRVSEFSAECMTRMGESIFILINAVLEGGVISGMMMDITQIKRAEEAITRSESRLREAQRIGHVGNWDWWVPAGELHWSDEVFRIFGLQPQQFEATYEAFLARIHPDDQQAVVEAVNQSLADPRRPYSIEHRVVRPDGKVCTVHERGEVSFDDRGAPVRMMGTVQDVTDLKRNEEDLRNALEEIRKMKEQLEAENIYLRIDLEKRDSYKDVIGESDAIRSTMRMCRQVARTKTTVLLSGETGTGKGVFARSIHRMSDQKDKPLVNVNCAGLSANLIESELFGREKGAFTGSTALQIGRFELANHGTIFLDEIGEMPLDLQVKILKVIEEGEFERLGNPRPVKVDIRVIASTNRDLEEEISKGRFRRDLYYRLNVFPINIPPLRDRKEDIPLLAEFYAEKFCKSYRKDTLRIPADTMEALVNYAWPGNVRELINIIERAVIVCDGPELRLGDAAVLSVPFQSIGGSSENVKKETTGSIFEMEREHILKALQKTGWKIEGPGGAARYLGLHPSTLRGRIRKHGIARPLKS